SFLSGSSSVRRSRRAGCSSSRGVWSGMVRACTVGRRIAVLGDRQGANLEKGNVAAVGREDALAEAAIGILADRFPDGLARERDRPFARALRPGISGGNERQRLAAVLELQVRGHP